MGHSRAACRVWVAWLACTQLFLWGSAQSQQCPPADRCHFNILCIGDSLTKGAVPSKQINHPYSIKLQQLMDRKFRDRATPKVTTIGYNYMAVFQKAHNNADKEIDLTLLPLLQQQLAAAKPQNSSKGFQWVVIMAGINDLGAGNYTAAEIMPKLIQAYKSVLQYGANVLAIAPFPNRFVAKNSSNEKQRRKLSSLMSDWVAAQPDSSDCSAPRVHLLRLPATWFDFWSMSPSRITKMQDDLLHLTEYGYDVLGEFVFGAISKRVPLGQCMCPTR